MCRPSIHTLIRFLWFISPDHLCNERLHRERWRQNGGATRKWTKSNCSLLSWSSKLTFAMRFAFSNRQATNSSHGFYRWIRHPWHTFITAEQTWRIKSLLRMYAETKKTRKLKWMCATETEDISFDKWFLLIPPPHTHKSTGFSRRFSTDTTDKWT